MTRKATLFLLLLFSATSLLAEVNFGINLGLRDEDDEDYTFGIFGLTADFGPASWIVRPEVGFFTDLNVLESEVEVEKSAGIVHSWRRPRYRINLGGGFTSVPSQRVFADQSANGGYVHVEMEYVREEGAAFGLDLRYVDAEELKASGSPFVPGDPISVDYVQLSFVIHWHFKGPKKP